MLTYTDTHADWSATVAPIGGDRWQWEISDDRLGVTDSGRDLRVPIYHGEADVLATLIDFFDAFVGACHYNREHVGVELSENTGLFSLSLQPLAMRIDPTGYVAVIAADLRGDDDD